MTMELLVFKTADEYLGIEAQYVHHLVDDATITPVPLVPSCYIGLMYYRGELFDVIDMGKLLGNHKPVSRENIRIILLKWSNKKLALVPEKIIGLNWVEDEENYSVRIISPDEIWKLLLETGNWKLET